MLKAVELALAYLSRLVYGYISLAINGARVALKARQ